MVVHMSVSTVLPHQYIACALNELLEGKGEKVLQATAPPCMLFDLEQKAGRTSNSNWTFETGEADAEMSLMLRMRAASNVFLHN